MSKEILKLALEALQTLHDENMDYLVRNKLGGENNQCMVFARDVIKSIKRTLAQPAVALEQEPVAWADHGVVNWIADKQFKHAALLYESPQRTWIGLDEEDDIDWEEGGSLRDLVEAVEAKLKEKNT